jgi:CheY-like chemotaxis protein
MLLDFQLPGRNAIQITKAVRDEIKKLNAQNGFVIAQPYVICVTSFLTPKFAKHLRANGIDRVYEKPIGLHKLK